MRITENTASRRVFTRGAVIVNPGSIPFYMNCILAPTQTVQGMLNFAGDSVTGDLRWVVPAGAEVDFVNAIDEDNAAIGNRFTALPLAPQSGVFTLTNPGRAAEQQRSSRQG